MFQILLKLILLISIELIEMLSLKIFRKFILLFYIIFLMNPIFHFHQISLSSFNNT